MSGTRSQGVYQPRPRGVEIAEKVEEARRTLVRYLRIAAMRGAGLLVLLAAAAVLLALVSYDPGDASLNNATDREVFNLMGPVGATAADLLLQFFGFAALAFLAPPIVWGTRAMLGWTLRYAVLRAFAWPLGTIFVAAGLGLLPPPDGLPAGAGGLIGIGAMSLTTRIGVLYQMPWIGWAAPILLFAAGLVLAILAADIRVRAILRNGLKAMAFVFWLGTLLKPGQAEKPRQRRIEPRKDDVAEEDDEDETEDADLDAAPSPWLPQARAPASSAKNPGNPPPPSGPSSPPWPLPRAITSCRPWGF
jgi:DNA segregation ATPase FtsK/SpoIIIE, S-DNA-T family